MHSSGDWKPTILGELVSIEHGWPFKSEFCSEKLTGKPIVVNIGNFEYTGGFRFETTRVREYRDEYPKEYELKPGDILLIMTCQTSGGEILGIPGRIPDDGRIYLHNQRLGKVVVKRDKEVSIDFLYWLFHWDRFNQHLYLTASGTKILHTAPSRIENFKFNLPPLSEQKAIANVLGTLDDKIELNRQMNQTLEGIARALFQSWFVDFDPVWAKLEGRPTSLPDDILVLFPREFEEHETFGEIPKGWQVKPLDKIAHYQNGLALQKYPPEGEEDYLPVIKIRELRQGHPDEKSNKASPCITEKCIIDNGDVIFSWSASLLVEIWCGGKGALNQHLFKVTSKQYPRWFCYFWTRHHLDNFQRIAADKATTMGHIKRSHLSEALVAIPPEPLIQKATEIIEHSSRNTLATSCNPGPWANCGIRCCPGSFQGSFACLTCEVQQIE